MKLVDYSENCIIPFLRNKLEETHAKGYVLGLSGGIDSALVALLAKRAVGKDKLLNVLMPIYSHSSDLENALELAKNHELRYVVKDLSNVYDIFKSDNPEMNTFTLSNVKVRLRMVELYALAQQNNYLVLGTDNACERLTGYFTKYGDGACDLLPISKLTKQEVFDLARHYGCTETILNRKPSAGLVLNQTDEEDLKVTYKELDNYILNRKDLLSSRAIERIEYLYKISRHKIDKIPEVEDFIRDWYF